MKHFEDLRLFIVVIAGPVNVAAGRWRFKGWRTLITYALLPLLLVYLLLPYVL